MSKIAFICTTHQSQKHRPNGFDLFNNYLESLYLSCEYSFKLFAFDNSSEDLFEIENNPDNLQLTYIENQYKGGLTYTWNEGVKQAINEGYDLCIITSDDQIFDKSINNFISDILDHPLNTNAVFGPLSNNPNNQYQYALKPHGRIFEISGKPKDELNGFCLAMTKETIKANYFDSEGNIFSTKLEDKWGHQDQELQSRVKHSIVVGTCYLHHIKQGGWRTIRKADINNMLSYD
jgi:GT2 family glycosyltransferase